MFSLEMTLLTGFIVIVGGLFAFFFVAIVLSALLEKRLIASFVRVNEAELPESSSYEEKMSQAARELGFKPFGPYAHAKGGTYKMYCRIWVSPDRQVLAVVGWGTIARLPSNRTRLLSLLEDGRYLVTSDQFDECDLSGLSVQGILLKADFPALVEKQRQRIAESGLRAVPFTSADPLRDYEVHTARRAEALEERGLAYFLDPARTVWRYNVRGALAMYRQTQARARAAAAAERASAEGASSASSQVPVNPFEEVARMRAARHKAGE